MGCPGVRGVLFFAPQATSDGPQPYRRKTQQAEGHPILPPVAAPPDTLTDHR